jgi:alpha-glucuronidase
MLHRKVRPYDRFLLFAMLVSSMASGAQTADQAWLRFSTLGSRTSIPHQVHALGTGVLEQSAAAEVERAVSGDSGTASPAKGQIELGTVAEVRQAFPSLSIPPDLGPEGFWLKASGTGSNATIVVAGADERGVLYGAFALLRLLATGQNPAGIDMRDQPGLKIRWVDEWDNPDGSIERGYAGRSIFFEGGNVRDDLAPVAEYAKLLASVGINGCNINNVNAAPQLLDPVHLKQIARIADAMRPWGVHLAMSVAIASPQTIGGLPNYDPMEPAVKNWWAAKTKEIYELIPDFAGFTVKADSEGQPGPASYGRTPADAANTLAAALAPHGGIVLYRAFVYNHHLDWQDPKADRARAAYDIFQTLDGQFAPNVIVQTKEGPIDFQVREPVSPLFAGLQHTSQAMEVQITQEYTGQQRHLVYLAPMWKEVLDFDLQVGGASTPVDKILAGSAFDQPTGGMVGVAGVGRDAWLGSPLALANLYAFGRLAWNPELDPEEIAGEWVRQTLGNDPEVVKTVVNMLMESWPAYEDYTGPLGLQTLTDITGSHYGPNIESSERNGWGQWHDADAHGLGKDRTVATGGGFAGQYPPLIARLYESPITTPDELLLFFHHVPFTHPLSSGSTVIQYLYDSHYRGAEQAAQFVKDWAKLKDRIDPTIYADVRARLAYQAGHAVVWRDAVVQYFFKLSGIPDEEGRAGHYPNRLEAENARLAGYRVIDVTPWEDASGGKAVSCDQPSTTGTQPSCKAEWTFNGKPGKYDIAVQYFDLQGGAAQFALLLRGTEIDSWKADAHLPSTRPNGDNSTRHTVEHVTLRLGDTLVVVGTPDGPDHAALDYVELLPSDLPASDSTHP